MAESDRRYKGMMERVSPAITTLVCAIIAAAAIAQDTTDPQPPVTDSSIATRIELGLPRISGDAPAVFPAAASRTSPVRPGLAGANDWMSTLAISGVELPRPSLLPEGTMLREREGRVWPGPGGLWIFVPSVTQRFPGEGPMLIAPNAELDRLVAMFEGVENSMPAVVSGLVLFYHSTNYLLMTNYTRVSRTSAATDPPDPMAQSPDSTAPQADPLRDPEVDALIAELQGESRAENRRADAMRQRLLSAQRTPSSEASGTAASTSPLLPEGSYIAQRRARLDRHGSGQWLLRFDGDTQALGDGSLVVIPSRILMLMEARVAGRPGASLIVSGRVYTYKNRGYFLPTMFQIEPPSDVKPLQ
ncbi:MAG: hypothetical protein KF757_03815 [Phycisphaeraceae bacterium]|nr:hypothetical protein [Phycisphaeraceae bacterium]MCW5763131.1 hypothetical protein [Phycisphaeraceae bacterium]